MTEIPDEPWPENPPTDEDMDAVFPPDGEPTEIPIVEPDKPFQDAPDG